MVKVGDAVTFTDREGVKRDALVTQVWSRTDKEPPAINLVYVSEDEKRTDQYGRQIVHETSIVHESQQPAPGFSWKVKK